MAQWWVFLLAGLMVSTSSWAGGFSGGDEYEAIKLSGNVHLQCRGARRGPRTRNIFCRGEILEPGEFTYFVTDQAYDADRVRLEALHEDGSRREKKVKYSAEKMRSKKPINLWVETLLQRALLELGVNAINYELLKDGNAVASGAFDVNVFEGPPRRCRPRTMFSNNPDDCQFGSPRASICRDYFRLENYCD